MNILARQRWHRPDRRRSMVMKNRIEHFGSTEMAPTGPSPVDGHEKITENILARPRWQRPVRACLRDLRFVEEMHGAQKVSRSHRTEMAPTGSSPLDGREKHIEPRWHRLDRACSTGYVFTMVKKSRQLIV